MVSLTSAWLAWRRHAVSAGWLLLSAILLVSLTTPVIAHGQGLAIGALVAILGIGITAATLPIKYSTWGNTLSLLTGAIVIVLDQALPDPGLYTEPIYTNVIAAILSTVFIIIIARQFNEFTLRAKLVIAFATITIIPLIILGIYNSYVTTQILTRESNNRLTALASNAAKQYDDFFIKQQTDILTDAKQTALVDYLLLPPQNRLNSVEENRAEITLSSFQRKDPVFVDSYGILDTTGRNVLDTSAEHIGSDESIRIYFTQVIKTGAPYTSNVLYIEGGEKSLYFSAPIKDAANRIIGVLRVEYHATILQMIAREITPSNTNMAVLLIDRSTYLRLAYTGNRDRLFKSYKEFSPIEIIALQSEGKIPPGKPEDVFSGADKNVTDGIDKIDSVPVFSAYSSSLGANAFNAGVRLKTHPWVALARETDTSNLAAVEKQKRNTVLISLALAGIAILLALGGAQVLASPLVSLTKVAEKIAAGDISARANINTQDEIGMLSNSFNRMTDELNATLNSLEERIAERTTDLESANQQSEKRAE